MQKSAEPIVGSTLEKPTKNSSVWAAPLKLALLAVATVGGFAAVNAYWGNESATTTRILSPSAGAIASTPLVASDGLATNLGAWKGNWLVVFFGYTSCPDVCPMELAYLSKELALLGSQAASVRGVFVSVDPERDQPVELGRYVHAFDKRFIGMTATPENLKALAKAFGAYYEKGLEPRPGAGYTMMHSAAFFLVSPKGEMVRTVSAPHENGELAKVLRGLVGPGDPAASARGDELTIASAWTRVPPPGTTTTALYMELTNLGDKALSLRSVAVEGAASAEFHESTLNANGVMEMHPLTDVQVPAGGKRSFAPGGAHVMVMGLAKPFKAGDVIDVTLTLSDGRQIKTEATARTF